MNHEWIANQLATHIARIRAVAQYSPGLTNAAAADLLESAECLKQLAGFHAKAAEEEPETPPVKK